MHTKSVILLFLSNFLVGKARAFVCNSIPREDYSCTTCIRAHKSCAWCRQNIFPTYSRCDTYENLVKYGCNKGNIEFQHTTLTIKKDEKLESLWKLTPNQTDTVQLMPQEIDVALKPGDTVTFTLTYRQSVDYPVDLYYLMDLSQSMKDDKQKITELGDLLANRMKRITSNFRFGFGSFVDKKAIPYMDGRKWRQEEPCDSCVPPYGFRNHLPLTNDTNKFAKEVKAANISGNLDSPEGGLDALIQALICQDEIGWRDQSRRILIYSSDAPFHYAGDGRLAGIVQPNDGKCHLDTKGYYTMSLEQDYPSVALLHEKIGETKTNVIFAVTKDQTQLYERLLNAMPDVSTSVGRLAKDSGNILGLVENEYMKICSKIVMTDNVNKSEGLSISYKAKCLPNDLYQDVNYCKRVRLGTTIQFKITLELEKCMEKRLFHVNIGPVGVSENTRVNVRALCDCGCAKDIEINSTECSSKGHLDCGICRCHDTFTGKRCQCRADDATTEERFAACKRTEQSEPCEGRGVCHCGECICNKRKNGNERISGTFCECDNFNCPRYERKLCAGNGDCICHQCVCNPGWAGEACQCSIATNSCIASSNGKICNDKGSCICGKCRCFANQTAPYVGSTCETCATCETKCEELKPCVLCQQFGTGVRNQTLCKQCPFKVITVLQLPKSSSKRQECRFVDRTDNCMFYFMYEWNEETSRATVFVQETKDCLSPVPVRAIVVSCTLMIVLIGIVILCLWKLITMAADRRECVQFENDTKEACYEESLNPMFKPATSTFPNPLYENEEEQDSIIDLETFGMNKRASIISYGSNHRTSIIILTE